MASQKTDQGLRKLEKHLSTAAQLLDKAARLVVDTSLEPAANVRIIGEALAGISQVRHAIYRQRPNLAPRFLKEWADEYRQDPKAEARDRRRTTRS